MRTLLLTLASVLAMTASAEDEHQVRPPLPSPQDIASLPPDGGPRFNRLVFESSPYLLQHAANPVDWYPWGDEAFARAKELDRPIFLSVGYSTCHWCHVMEHESFEDEAVAELMNEAFVCVKVDREERPDLDQVYMSVTQAMTGSGGWPMTVLLTPDGEPFFAATYIPKESRFGRRGMLDLVPHIQEVWQTRRDDVVKDAERIVQHVSRMSTDMTGSTLGPEVLDRAYEQLSQGFDPRYGGFSQRPKFPVPHNLLFLLQRHQRTDEAKALEMVTRTLDEMRRGGIYDHVGFGFHRYSTDQEWLVPHFEKMLYDQALLTMAYTAAWQVTGDDEYRRTAEEVLTYVLRDMTSPEGGFYSAEDADSEGEEGLFYIWTEDEVTAVLGEDDANLYRDVYGFARDGNFRDESKGTLTGRNIPHLGRALAAEALDRGMQEDELRARLESARERLFEARERRIHPLKDDKVLTDWNGLMIAALSRAATAFDEPRYADAARRAADFVLAELVDDEGRVAKRWRLGQAGLPGTLEDYAFLAWGLLEVYEATFDVRYLHDAKRIVDAMIRHFAAEKGGFYLSADDGLELFLRPKEIYDGAIPSGNSVAAMVLMRLARITTESDYEKHVEGIFRAFSRRTGSSPIGHTFLLWAVDFAVHPSYEIVIAGAPEAADTRALLRAVHERYLPNKVLLLREADDAEVIDLAPYAEAQGPLEGRATAYVCQSFTCNLPTTDAGKMLELLAD